MTDSSANSNATDLPDGLVEQLRELEDHQLRETIDLVQDLLSRRIRLSLDELKADNEDIVRIEEKPGYTLVVRRETQGTVLYRVKRVHDPNGNERLDWHYIGPVVDN